MITYRNMYKSISDFEEIINGKNVAVLGVAVSNTPLIEVLAKFGARITAFDRADAGALADRMERLKPCGIEYRLGPDYLSGLAGFDWIFRTPVIRPDIPELVSERIRGAILTSEMELFLELCPAKTIGVTGSDGKTTTTTLIYEILKARGYNCYLGGNIGNPLLQYVGDMTPEDIAVVELSSFQLMTMKKSVDVAVITNLSPNHLDVHKSYEEYIGAKKNIFMHQAENGYVVLNYDNAETRALGASAPGRVGYFTRTDATSLLAYCEAVKPKPAAVYPDSGNNIAYRDAGNAGDVEIVIPAGDIKIPGAHNIENYMAAICAVRHFVNRSDIESVARNFNGVEHRIEYIRTFEGVRYYNDSIASSPTRTIACLNTFENKIILIAGGKDKELDFSTLGKYLHEKVKLLILCGQTSEKIRRSLLDYCISRNMPNSTPIIDCEN